uniref:Uncharacterized protein n=1 Tax=Chromera velia CCMP2878 TaxID=1169474 RepID=A0A0G4H974_9ALVE|eukprot:Cvel_25359.t1-p1 / transcript=Cvel_25359.t1 / gene=Cvel_25359 / organism=Chromera_velia_CCMP2878 / gene_product=hypothetical protein / transcript_product=hypothetical protein / location=Cvel_scaffold2862:3961-11927(+) / protein_length=1875 / sequence_SO=supercontig / SO=protein_coding / is_pseudo=false
MTGDEDAVHLALTLCKPILPRCDGASGDLTAVISDLSGDSPDCDIKELPCLAKNFKLSPSSSLRVRLFRNGQIFSENFIPLKHVVTFEKGFVASQKIWLKLHRTEQASDSGEDPTDQADQIEGNYQTAVKGAAELWVPKICVLINKAKERPQVPFSAASTTLPTPLASFRQLHGQGHGGAGGEGGNPATSALRQILLRKSEASALPVGARSHVGGLHSHHMHSAGDGGLQGRGGGPLSAPALSMCSDDLPSEAAALILKEKKKNKEEVAEGEAERAVEGPEETQHEEKVVEEADDADAAQAGQEAEEAPEVVVDETGLNNTSAAASGGGDVSLQQQQRGVGVGGPAQLYRSTVLNVMSTGEEGRDARDAAEKRRDLMASLETIKIEMDESQKKEREKKKEGGEEVQKAGEKSGDKMRGREGQTGGKDEADPEENSSAKESDSQIEEELLLSDSSVDGREPDAASSHRPHPHQHPQHPHPHHQQAAMQPLSAHMQQQEQWLLRDSYHQQQPPPRARSFAAPSERGSLGVRSVLNRVCGRSAFGGLGGTLPLPSGSSSAAAGTGREGGLSLAQLAQNLERMRNEVINYQQIVDDERASMLEQMFRMKDSVLEGGGKGKGKGAGGEGDKQSEGVADGAKVETGDARAEVEEWKRNEELWLAGLRDLTEKLGSVAESLRSRGVAGDAIRAPLLPIPSFEHRDVDSLLSRMEMCVEVVGSSERRRVCSSLSRLFDEVSLRRKLGAFASLRLSACQEAAAEKLEPAVGRGLLVSALRWHAKFIKSERERTKREKEEEEQFRQLSRERAALGRERFVEGEGEGGVLEGREGSMVSLMRRRFNAVGVEDMKALSRSYDSQASEEDPENAAGERDGVLDQPDGGPRGVLSSLRAGGGDRGESLRLSTLLASVREEEEEEEGGCERDRDGRENGEAAVSAGDVRDATDAEKEKEEVEMEAGRLTARALDFLDREEGRDVAAAERTASMQTDSVAPALGVPVGTGTEREGVGGMAGQSPGGGDGERRLHAVEATLNRLMSSLSEKEKEKDRETPTSSSSRVLRRDPVHVAAPPVVFYTSVTGERVQLQRPPENLRPGLPFLARGSVGSSEDAVRGDGEDEQDDDDRVDDSTPELRSLPSAQTARVIGDRGGVAHPWYGGGQRAGEERRSVSVIDRRGPPHTPSNGTDREHISSSFSMGVGGRPMPPPPFSFAGQTTPLSSHRLPGAPPHPHPHQHPVHAGRPFPPSPFLSQTFAADGDRRCLSVVPQLQKMAAAAAAAAAQGSPFFPHTRGPAWPGGTLHHQQQQQLPAVQRHATTHNPPMHVSGAQHPSYAFAPMPRSMQLGSLPAFAHGQGGVPPAGQQAPGRFLTYSQTHLGSASSSLGGFDASTPTQQQQQPQANIPPRFVIGPLPPNHQHTHLSSGVFQGGSPSSSGFLSRGGANSSLHSAAFPTKLQETVSSAADAATGASAAPEPSAEGVQMRIAAQSPDETLPGTLPKLKMSLPLSQVCLRSFSGPPVSGREWKPEAGEETPLPAHRRQQAAENSSSAAVANAKPTQKENVAEIPTESPANIVREVPTQQLLQDESRRTGGGPRTRTPNYRRGGQVTSPFRRSEDDEVSIIKSTPSASPGSKSIGTPARSQKSVSSIALSPSPARRSDSSVESTLRREGVPPRMGVAAYHQGCIPPPPLEEALQAPRLSRDSTPSRAAAGPSKEKEAANRFHGPRGGSNRLSNPQQAPSPSLSLTKDSEGERSGRSKTNQTQTRSESAKRPSRALAKASMATTASSSTAVSSVSASAAPSAASTGPSNRPRRGAARVSSGAVSGSGRGTGTQSASVGGRTGPSSSASAGSIRRGLGGTGAVGQTQAQPGSSRSGAKVTGPPTPHAQNG